MPINQDKFKVYKNDIFQEITGDSWGLVQAGIITKEFPEEYKTYDDVMNKTYELWQKCQDMGYKIINTEN